MSEMTERQEKAWPEAVADLNRIADNAIPASIHNWTVEWSPESRPGRGHHMNAVYNDGEYFCQIIMDVYGYPSTSIAELDWLHASSDEECPCGCNDDPESHVSEDER